MDKLVTYFESIPGFFVDALGVQELWNWSWSSWGWQPRVVGKRLAMQHPKYAALVEKVAKFPTVNNAVYEAACFTRWCAAAMAAPCWFGDFDVLNYGFWPFQPSVSTTLAARPDMFGTVWGSRADFEKVIDVFLGYELKETDQFKGEPHISDYLVLIQHPGLWTEVRPLEQQPDVPGWERYPLVHFAGAQQPEKVSRAAWMISARPGWCRPLLFRES